jgi:hypothetical protein
MYGAPVSLLSDQGGEFMNNLLTAICEQFSITKLWTTAYHPRTNGHTEVMNRTLKTALRSYATQYPRKWDLYIPGILAAYRSSVHEATKFSPYYLLFGRHMRLPIDATLAAQFGIRESDAALTAAQEIQEAMDNLAEARARADQNESLSREKSAARFNKGRKLVEYQIGDHVRVWMPAIRIGPERKALAAVWDDGPWEVTKQLGPNTFRVLDLSMRRGNHPYTVHTDRMQPILSPSWEREKDAGTPLTPAHPTTMDVAREVQEEQEDEDDMDLEQEGQGLIQQSKKHTPLPPALQAAPIPLRTRTHAPEAGPMLSYSGRAR